MNRPKTPSAALVAFLLAAPLHSQQAAAESPAVAIGGCSVEAVAGVEFALDEVKGRRGEAVELPMSTRTDCQVSVLLFSVVFDPQDLQFLDPPRLQPGLQAQFELVSEADREFSWTFDNEAGWLQVHVVFDFRAREELAVPQALLRRGVLLDFHVAEDASDEMLPVAFSNSAEAVETQFFSDGEPVFNRARILDRVFDPETLFEDSVEPELLDGVVRPIVGDVGFFRKGDVNLDNELDISDPLRLLSSLFQNSSALPCRAVADYNGDSLIDVADPIAILDALFLTRETALNPIAGEAPAAEDSLDLITCAL